MTDNKGNQQQAEPTDGSDRERLLASQESGKAQREGDSATDASFSEETAAEVVPDLNTQRIRENARRAPQMAPEREVDEEADESLAAAVTAAAVTPWMAWGGLVISILALFMFPVVMGAIGAVLGFVGYSRGARTVGMWAMGIGVLAIVGALILSPLMVR